MPLKNGEQLFAVISREATCPRPLVVAVGAAMLEHPTYARQRDGFAAASLG